MTFLELQKANETIKTTDIGKGKEYAEVNQRIKAFRMLHPEGCIATEMISNVDGVCIFRATVMNADGMLLGSGTAYEKEGASFINKNSYIENCETSAVGRALAMCGIGIDTSVASLEEVQNAIANQQKPEQPKEANAIEYGKLKAAVLGYMNKHYNEVQIEKICMKYEIKKINDISAENCQDFMALLKAQGKDINE